LSLAISLTFTLTGSTAQKSLPLPENNSLGEKHSNLPNELMMLLSMHKRIWNWPSNVKANRPTNIARNLTLKLEIVCISHARVGPLTSPTQNLTTNMQALSKS
jgi:hypothetical protein